MFHSRRRRHLVRMSAPFFLIGYGWNAHASSEEERYYGRNDHKGKRRHQRIRVGHPHVGAARRYGHSDDGPYQIFPAVPYWALV